MTINERMLVTLTVPELKHIITQAIDEAVSRIKPEITAAKETEAHGVKNISKALGCPETELRLISKRCALGWLLWRRDNNEKSTIHLDNVERGRRRYKYWQALAENERQAFSVEGLHGIERESMIDKIEEIYEQLGM